MKNYVRPDLVGLVISLVNCLLGSAAIFVSVNSLFGVAYEDLYARFYLSLMLASALFVLIHGAESRPCMELAPRPGGETDRVVAGKGLLWILASFLLFIGLWQLQFVFPLVYICLLFILYACRLRLGKFLRSPLDLQQYAGFLIPLLVFYAWYDYFLVYVLILGAFCLLVACQRDDCCGVRDIKFPVVASGAEIVALACIGLGLVAFGFLVKRPDMDDVFYLDQIGIMLELPQLEPLRYLRAPDLSLEAAPIDTTLANYLGLVATVARYFDLDVHVVYYVLFPTVWLLVYPWVAWRYASFFSSSHAVFAVVLSCAVLVLWGETHRAYGNMSFLRLYQGKAVLMTVYIPLIACAAASFCRRVSLPSAVALLLALIAAVSLNSTAIVVGPAAVLCMAVSMILLDRGRIIVVSVSLALIVGAFWAYCLLNLLGLDGVPAAFRGASPAGLSRAAGDDVFPLWQHQVYGFGQGYVLLGWAAFACLFLQFTRRAAVMPWAVCLFLVYVTVAVLPAVGRLATELVVPTLSWRFPWLAPWFLVVAGLAAMTIERVPQRGALRGRLLTAVAVSSSLLASLYCSGGGILSADNKAFVSTAAHPFDRSAYALAEELVRGVEASDKIIAPFEVSSIIALFPDRPPLFVSRKSANDDNNELVRMISMPQTVSASRAREVLAQLARHSVGIVILPDVARGSSLLSELRSDAFHCRERYTYLVCSNSRSGNSNWNAVLYPAVVGAGSDPAGR